VSEGEVREREKKGVSEGREREREEARTASRHRRRIDGSALSIALPISASG